MKRLPLSATARAVLWLTIPFVATASPLAVTAEESLVEKLRSAVVKIGRLDADRSFVPLGTGFFVDGACTIATANHVVRTSARVTVQAPAATGGRPLFGSAEVLKRFEQNDIAFLQVDLGEKPCEGYGHLPPPARIRQRELNGAEVLIAGFPSLEGGLTTRTPVYRRGIVASGEFGVPSGGTRVPMYLLDLTGIPGFSGSPVVLAESGEVIAIVHGPRRTERKFDLEWATPLWEGSYRAAIKPR